MLCRSYFNDTTNRRSNSNYARSRQVISTTTKHSPVVASTAGVRAKPKHVVVRTDVPLNATRSLTENIGNDDGVRGRQSGKTRRVTHISRTATGAPTSIARRMMAVRQRILREYSDSKFSFSSQTNRREHSGTGRETAGMGRRYTTTNIRDKTDNDRLYR